MFVAAARILTFPDEYDSFIPNVTAGDYILDAIQQYGNDIACVSDALLFLKNLNLTNWLNLNKSIKLF